MEQFTKQHAGQIYGFDYKIWKDGKTYKVTGITDNEIFTCQSEFECDEIYFSEIGKTAFIPARPFSDLTKEIEGIGIPLVELAKIENDDVGQTDYYVREDSVLYNDCYFGFNESGNSFEIICPTTGNEHVNNQNELFNQLKSWKFPIGLPEGSWKDLNEMKL